MAKAEKKQITELADAFGNIVHVGDEVVYVQKFCDQSRLAVSKVIALKADHGRPRFVMRSYKISGFHHYDFTCWPQNVMKLNNAEQEQKNG